MSKTSTPSHVLEQLEHYKNPFDKLDYLLGLSGLSWTDCQDAWFESNKLFPQLREEYERVARALKLAEGIISVSNQRDSASATVVRRELGKCK